MAKAMSASYVTMESQKLREWCLIVIDYIESYRRSEREKRIDRELKRLNKPRKNHWWWFNRKKKPVSREEVIALLSASEFGYSPLDYCNLHGGRAMEVAESLLAASRCAHAVHVTVEDIEYLDGWSPDGYTESFNYSTGYR